jgi:hypothetical protein
MKNADRRLMSALVLAVALATMGQAQSTQTRPNNSASIRRDLLLRLYEGRAGDDDGEEVNDGACRHASSPDCDGHHS